MERNRLNCDGNVRYVSPTENKQIQVILLEFMFIVLLISLCTLIIG